MAYAQNTSVSIGRSRDEVEATAIKYGADQVAYYTSAKTAMVVFVHRGRQIRFALDLPASLNFTRTPTGPYGTAMLPFVAELRGGSSDARTVTDPLATVTACGNHHALITRHCGIEGGDPAHHSTPAGQQLRTITDTGGNMSLLTPYYGNAGSARPATDPLGTLTTHDRYALVHRHNSGGAEMLTPAFEELRTLTTAGHQSILRSAREVTAADLEAAKRLLPECLFRMFKPMECAAGMAFPAAYRWDVRDAKGKLPSNRNLVRAIGNAVCPPCARDILGAIATSVYGSFAEVAA